MKWKHAGIVAIGAAIVAVIYWLTRPSGVAIATQSPATSQSGLPQYTPQAQSFNVNPPLLAPSPGLQFLPEAQRPSLNFVGPTYATYNMPTIVNLVPGSNSPAAGPNGGSASIMPQPQAPANPGQSTPGGNCGCGCAGSCGCGAPAGTMHYPDGSGNAYLQPAGAASVASEPMNQPALMAWLGNIQSAPAGPPPRL